MQRGVGESRALEVPTSTRNGGGKHDFTKQNEDLLIYTSLYLIFDSQVDKQTPPIELGFWAMKSNSLYS